jgi:hypothetical protein
MKNKTLLTILALALISTTLYACKSDKACPSTSKPTNQIECNNSAQTKNPESTYKTNCKANKSKMDKKECIKCSPTKKYAKCHWCPVKIK